MAIKRFEKSKLTAKEAVHVAREVHLMGTLKAEDGIIHILGFFEDENYAYIVMVSASQSMAFKNTLL